MKKYHVKDMKQVFIVDDLPKTGFELSLVATDEECAELATQINVDEIFNFSAKLLIKQWRRGGVHIEGEFTTKLNQVCVLSLETFETEFTESIDQKFFASTKIPDLNDKNEGEMLDNDLDPPEALVDGKLDIFDYLAESLLLQLDPYPKKPGSQLESLAQDDRFQLNQPTSEDEIEVLDEDGNVSEVKSKSKATHKPFADLSKLLKDK